jgi:hypothetical protein
MGSLSEKNASEKFSCLGTFKGSKGTMIPDFQANTIPRIFFSSQCHHKIQEGRNPGKVSLKLPKHENFLLTYFTQSEPIWVSDLGTGKK